MWNILVSLLVFGLSATASIAEESSTQTQQSTSATSETTEVEEREEDLVVRKERELGLCDLLAIRPRDAKGVHASEVLTKVGALHLADVGKMKQKLEEKAQLCERTLKISNVSDQDRKSAVRALEVELAPVLATFGEVEFAVPAEDDDLDTGMRLADVRELQVLAFRLKAWLAELFLHEKEAELKVARRLLHEAGLPKAIPLKLSKKRR